MTSLPFNSGNHSVVGHEQCANRHPTAAVRVEAQPAEAIFDVTPAEAFEPALRLPAVDQRKEETTSSDDAGIFVKCRNFQEAAPTRDAKERKV